MKAQEEDQISQSKESKGPCTRNMDEKNATLYSGGGKGTPSNETNGKKAALSLQSWNESVSQYPNLSHIIATDSNVILVLMGADFEAYCSTL